MKKILIVSESDVITKSFVSFLKAKDKDVTQITSATAALEKIFNEKFDLLICSVFLDGIDGVQLVNTIRGSYSINSQMKICMITSDESIQELFHKENQPDII